MVMPFDMGRSLHRFPVANEAIASVMLIVRWRDVDPSRVGAHGESPDQLLSAAPAAAPRGSRIAVMVSIDDLADGEALPMARHTIQWFDTPHLPRGWDSALLRQLARAVIAQR